MTRRFENCFRNHRSSGSAARFLRNVLIAIGNSKDKALAVPAERLLQDANPLVRGAAVWALSQLIDREDFSARAAQALDQERDESVRREWRS